MPVLWTKQEDAAALAALCRLALAWGATLDGARQTVYLDALDGLAVQDVIEVCARAARGEIEDGKGNPIAFFPAVADIRRAVVAETESRLAAERRMLPPPTLPGKPPAEEGIMGIERCRAVLAEAERRAEPDRLRREAELEARLKERKAMIERQAAKLREETGDGR